nr:MAG TPA: hypothetical protein [Caudoviricetes sp.]
MFYFSFSHLLVLFCCTYYISFSELVKSYF